MTFQERLWSTSSLHLDLLSTLSITCNASREARETTRYIAVLQSRIAAANKNIKSLHFKVSRLRAEYEGLRDGSTKRLFSKVSGKTDEFLAKMTRAELDYQDAFEEHARANKTLESDRQDLEKARLSLPHLHDQAAIHAATQAELDDLYSSVFSHPHADYPQEVAANQEIAGLQLPIVDLQSQLDTEAKTLKYLSKARKSLTWAHAAIQNAQRLISYTASSLDETDETSLSVVRNALSLMQLHALAAETAYEAAQLVHKPPVIPNLRIMKILGERFLVGNGFSGNVWGSMRLPLLADGTELAAMIKASVAEIGPVIEDVEKEVTVASERVQALGAEKGELEDEAKDAMRKARAAVYGATVGGDRNGREEDNLMHRSYADSTGEGSRPKKGGGEGHADAGLPGYSP